MNGHVSRLWPGNASRTRRSYPTRWVSRDPGLNPECHRTQDVHAFAACLCLVAAPLSACYSSPVSVISQGALTGLFGAAPRANAAFSTVLTLRAVRLEYWRARMGNAIERPATICKRSNRCRMGYPDACCSHGIRLARNQPGIRENPRGNRRDKGRPFRTKTRPCTARTGRSALCRGESLEVPQCRPRPRTDSRQPAVSRALRKNEKRTRTCWPCNRGLFSRRNGPSVESREGRRIRRFISRLTFAAICCKLGDSSIAFWPLFMGLWSDCGKLVDNIEMSGLRLRVG